jgi:hypothetical protein
MPAAIITDSKKHTRLRSILCEVQFFLLLGSQQFIEKDMKKTNPKESCRNKTVLYLCVRLLGRLYPARLLANWHGMSCLDRGTMYVRTGTGRT